jgi:dolichol-phosphate mannosyltransferase
MIYVVLPAFNEEKGIGAVLTKLADMTANVSEKWRIIVVDDGSRDRTSEIARTYKDKLDLHVIQFPQNRGVADVFREGFGFVCTDSEKPEEDICVLLDSDNTQDPLVIWDMIKKIREGEDVVIASRFEGEGKMIGCPFQRQLFSYGISWILRALVRLPNVKDYSTFYRAYRVSILKDALERFGASFFEGKGFAVAAGMLLKLGIVTRRFAEIPLILRYDLKGGASGNKIMKTITGYLGLIWLYVVTAGFRRSSPS